MSPGAATTLAEYSMYNLQLLLAPRPPAHRYPDIPSFGTLLDP